MLEPYGGSTACHCRKREDDASVVRQQRSTVGVSPAPICPQALHPESWNYRQQMEFGLATAPQAGQGAQIVRRDPRFHGIC